MSKINVFWFRRDLRLEDNKGLYEALSGPIPVMPVFIFDSQILDQLDHPDDARVTFIHQSVKELYHRLKKLGSALFVFHGRPVDVFKTLLAQHEIAEVYTNKDYEPYARQRDGEVAALLKSNNIPFLPFKDHVIFESLEVARENGEPYRVYTPYKNRWMTLLSQNHIAEYPSETLAARFLKTAHSYFPTLGDIGFTASTIEIPALKLDEHVLRAYDKTRDFPAAQGTSRLGVHLRHGTLSIRKAVKEAMRLNKVWLQELIWREFYIMILDNFPNVAHQEFNPKYRSMPWRHDEDQFRRWCEGTTGYPIVDAGMRELNATGYMHNRVRMITASFLTKHLLIDWRWGEAYFAQRLLDYELASNNGGWQWAGGCGTDAQPYFRIFNPYEQARKFDPKGQYIKKWVKEINTGNYPDPIIDHKFARERAIATFKKALET